MSAYLHINRIWPLLVLTLTGLSLVGCQSTATFYRGYLVDNQSIAPLESKAQHSWQTIDIDLIYQMELISNSLMINGSIAFGPNQKLRDMINSFNFYLFFLDGEDLVLQTEQLAWGSYISPEEQLRFETSLPIPSAAKSIAFGYKGKTREDIGPRIGGGVSLPFYKLPKRPE